MTTQVGIGIACWIDKSRESSCKSSEIKTPTPHDRYSNDKNLKFGMVCSHPHLLNNMGWGSDLTTLNTLKNWHDGDHLLLKGFWIEVRLLLRKDGKKIIEIMIIRYCSSWYNRIYKLIGRIVINVLIFQVILKADVKLWHIMRTHGHRPYYPSSRSFIEMGKT